MLKDSNGSGRVPLVPVMQWDVTGLYFWVALHDIVVVCGIMAVHGIVVWGIVVVCGMVAIHGIEAVSGIVAVYGIVVCGIVVVCGIIPVHGSVVVCGTGVKQMLITVS